MNHSTSIQAKKKELRLRLRKWRRALSQEEVKHQSKIICDRIMTMPVYRQAQCLALYFSFENEVDLSQLLHESFGKRRIVAPRIVSQSVMELREVSPHATLTRNRYGIEEPKQSQPLVEPSEPDLVLVPGIAFDRLANRLGLGAGYYDRLLRVNRGFHLGVCYGFQCIDQVPIEAHDQALNEVVSEA